MEISSGHSPTFSLLPFLLVVLSFSPAAGHERLDPKLAVLDSVSNIAWYDARLVGVEGKGWTDTGDYYDRLPARAKGLVRDEVWSLSKNSAGLCVRFLTEATEIWVEWDGGGGFPHMPATGVSGVDLYVRESGRWRYVNVGRPKEERTKIRLAGRLAGTPTEYLLYLPLYNRVTDLKIGIPAKAGIFKVPPPPGKPIVFYGTSITQGGCASRPGMPHTAILGRWLERQVINLGFSGNGRMEPEMARLLAELDPAVYIIDCIPNVDEEIGELTEPFVKIIRNNRPETCILLVEDTRPGDAKANGILSAAYKRLVLAGDRNVFLLKGEGLVGDDGEATVDGRHPTDLGFMRMARGFMPVLSVLLKPE